MKTPRIGLVAIALVGLVLQLPADGKVTLRATATSTIDAQQSGAHPCTREDLKIKEGETDAAMGGVRRTPYVLTNNSQTACTLKGYPSVELLNKAGAVVKRAKNQKTEDRIIAATLEPGKSAWFALDFNAGGAGYMGKPCPVYRQIRITSPGAQRPFVLKTQIQSCGKTDFDVTPIVAGTPE